ncbi:MAG: hypothetical protein OEY64_03880 [Nitrospinota bacterium]|nr:hypothetical protein [Nitrospinota bacterium]
MTEGGDDKKLRIRMAILAAVLILVVIFLYVSITYKIVNYGP